MWNMGQQKKKGFLSAAVRSMNPFSGVERLPWARASKLQCYGACRVSSIVLDTKVSTQGDQVVLGYRNCLDRLFWSTALSTASTVLLTVYQASIFRWTGMRAWFKREEERI
jgi:hypothetical protein